MTARRFYLITALPPLGEPGSVPPMTLAALRDHVADTEGPRELVEAVLLADDLIQRDALLAGQIDQADPAVLTARQMRDEQPLPDCLAAGSGQPDAPGSHVAADAVWSAYFRHADQAARRWASPFLAGWAAMEVALRNALVEQRAAALNLDPDEYRVAADQADRTLDLAGLVAEWSAAADPLEGLRILDRWRWQWIREHDSWFSFGDDELAAYAAKLSLLHRWHRLAEAGRRRPPAERAGQSQT